MSDMEKTTARAFGGPMRYIQGPGEFSSLERYASAYSARALVLIDGFLFAEFSERLGELYGRGDAQCRPVAFGGECCREEADRVAGIAREFGAGILIGVGGGKTLDTVKIVANDLDLPYFIVPTSASSDAPTSSMSVLYTEDGAYLRGIRHKRGAQLVLADSEIIAKAPVRLFVAGMGDALATYYEALANEQSGGLNFVGPGYRQCKTSMAIATLCRGVLFEDGRAAKRAVEQGTCTRAVENVIEANILMSGLGFENAGLACAHGIHAGLTQLPAAHGALHGEKVAFGLVCQMVLEAAPPQTLAEVLEFLGDVGLPVTLGQLNVENTPDNIRVIAHTTAVENKLIQGEPFPVTEEAVYDAILAADSLGREYLAGKETNGGHERNEP